jgi:hypothetical protein
MGGTDHFIQERWEEDQHEIKSLVIQNLHLNFMPFGQEPVEAGRIPAQGRAETLNPCQQGATYGRITILVDNLDQWVHSRFLTPLRCAPDQSRPDGGSPNAEHPLLPTMSTCAPAIYPPTIHVPGEAPRPDPCSSAPVGGASPGSVCTGERLIPGGTPPFARGHGTLHTTPGISPPIAIEHARGDRS